MRCILLTAAALLAACVPAHAEASPCKPDQFNGLTCGVGPGAARVIEGTTSPDNRLAFAWRDPGKAPTEEPDIYNVESVLIQLHDGRALAMAPGGFWNTSTMRVNHYDFHAIWSPDSNYVIELLDFRWSTETLRLYALRKGDAPLSLDLKPIIELAVRKYLRKTIKNEAFYAFEIQAIIPASCRA